MQYLIVFVVFLLISFLTIDLSQTQPIQSLFNFRKLDLPLTSRGPESITFDLSGGGPYTGISDGRVVKYDGSTFLDLYITSPNRSSLICDGIQNNSPALGLICGRPLGLGFYYLRNELYIADAYRGLLVVRVDDRLALPIISSDHGEGAPYKLLDGLDVDQLNGDIYFTDASARFDLSQLQEAIAANDSTGRLLKYSRRTKQVTVLLNNLGGPAGVALSLDRRFVLVTEYIANRIKKLWLSGPKAFQTETIITFKGRPDNIKRATIFGAFWVALNEPSSLGGLNTNVPKAIMINANGNILKSFDLSKDYYNMTISEFQQRGGQYYVGSLEADFVGLYN